ncbi:uncharacterized protein BO66DRAFT_405727 [Aspergillus aculeatinus CBS 121060]|uniref:Uncharacterized protein n=2 Tax=Aspergillus TaxID=5052 RepID=A0A8G1RST0_9EURO|nr:hypothetical protein BO66DRAFT_405727 [Aspergillus aculeatinus CBS 121060]XP_040800881.1 uncharacterized protein BO72DRAFT_122667 [Aspergillus fijiensis CBS 313.89]RAH65271.1 hypothetical protein BO66DRAFT_405727 [Aspergillus aculeatinus CBS 121060]RAK76871.1 hypothetical protein BO72DRAFT_122667 [Aspergillus fijiensis CBS 313.89]
MKSFTTIIASILIAAVSAAPAPVDIEARVNSVTVSLANDQSGANAGVPIPGDGVTRSIQTLYGGTSVGSSGKVLASSAQLTNFAQWSSCNIVNGGRSIAYLNSQRTFADLDGNPNAATPVDLSGATITCWA